MERCRNCGQNTLATLDWACPWCGFPLKKGKRLEVTYAQAVKLRREPEEPLFEMPFIAEPPVVPVPPVEEKPAMADEEEPVIIFEDEIEIEEEYLAPEKMIEFENKILDEKGSEPQGCEFIIDEKTGAWEEVIRDVPGVFGEEEPCGEPEPAALPEEAICGEPVGEAKDAPVEPQPEEPEPAGEPEAAAELNITLEELMDAYQDDEAEAGSLYGDKVLALAGVIALVNIREGRDFQYLTLAGKDQNIFRSIKCVFNMSRASQLKGLERGREVTVTGRFKGTLTSMSLVDCRID
jgi:ribosomal protein L37E